jgi:hypothetical protein
VIPFAVDVQKTSVDQFVVSDVSADVVHGFLRHVEEGRGCDVRNRNQRSAAIHALPTFVESAVPS